MASETKLTTASVLAFERKLDTSDALFTAGTWEDRASGDRWAPIALREKSVRGTISNRLAKKGDDDPAKLNQKIESPNPQTVDVATLPSNFDTLRVSFTLKVLPGAGMPSACNNSEYSKKLQEIVAGYREEFEFSELARRYAYNLANARFLWRNRLGAETVEVVVRQLVDGKETSRWTFDALKLSLRSLDQADDPEVRRLAAVVQQGLNGNGFVLLEVVACARMGLGQEVFPSQELVMEKGQGTKSKTLYSVGDVAAMHSQKIGNALRTIDTWYPDAAAEGLGPIAVEPYGSVTSQGKAYRQPKQKCDFYSLLDGWMIDGKKPDQAQQHYVMATLIRGGVFGAAEK